MLKLNESLLTNYMNNFFGYGNLNGKYWFVGMEEGGGGSFEEINSRLTSWNTRGKHILEDIYEYHVDINVPKWFHDKAPLQSTWNRLIRILLSYKNMDLDKETVRAYQISHLGRANGETALLELMPLPSKSVSVWQYPLYSNNPSLSNRNIYHKDIGHLRVKTLINLIQENEPEFLVFYGISGNYFERWKEIIGDDLEKDIFDEKPAYFTKINLTKVSVVQHPTSTGITLNYFHEAGNRLRKL